MEQKNQPDEYKDEVWPLYFGACPGCGRNQGYLNIFGLHFFVCHTHRTRWVGAEDVFSCWRKESIADWQKNWERIQDYENVEPVFHDLE